MHITKYGYFVRYAQRSSFIPIYRVASMTRASHHFGVCFLRPIWCSLGNKFDCIRLVVVIQTAHVIALKCNAFCAWPHSFSVVSDAWTHLSHCAIYSRTTAFESHINLIMMLKNDCSCFRGSFFCAEFLTVC